jgi:eukaryotic-like serine/threonine-protein kinase
VNDTVRPDGSRPFGEYELQRRIGVGGMGQVWLAQSRGRGLDGVERQCVVKLLRSDDDEEYERRFIDEARLIVLLNHKNICNVFDAGCIDGTYYLAMDYVDGCELREVQARCDERAERLDVDVTIHIVKEVLEALDVAHRQKHPTTKQALQIVHRDVSPQNVMVSREGDIKLIDFGLAASTQKLEKTAPRIVMGKLNYMAPEQARGEPLDGRADQFAMGLLLYELLSNGRYYGGTPQEEMWRIVGKTGFEPPPLDDIPDSLRNIVRRATSRDAVAPAATCETRCRRCNCSAANSPAHAKSARR